MLPENELLQYVYKTADMGVVGIESVMEYAADAKLKNVLSDQMAEYKKFCRKAESMLAKVGGEKKETNVFAKAATEATAVGKLMIDPSASKIAEMMIQGSSMGVSKTIKHLHEYTAKDEARSLCERLLSTQQANIEQMKPFL